jgi:hypothetical protein
VLLPLSTLALRLCRGERGKRFIRRAGSLRAGALAGVANFFPIAWADVDYNESKGGYVLPYGIEKLDEALGRRPRDLRQSEAPTKSEPRGPPPPRLSKTLVKRASLPDRSKTVYRSPARDLTQGPRYGRSVSALPAGY